MRHLNQFAGAAAIAVLCGTAWAQPATYSVTTPGILPGGTFSVARGLSSAGHLAGYGDTASSDSQPWVASGAALSLFAAAGSPSFANAVNASGTAAGHSFAADFSTYTAFVTNGAAIINIPTLGGAYNSALALNDTGTVVGYSENGSREVVAFRYSAGTVTSLGTLPGGSTSRANAINGTGQIVGESDTAGGATHAFLNSGGVWTDLGVLAGYASSEATAISSSGAVAGVLSTANGTQQAFLWRAPNGMTALGTLGGDSIARGVNAANLVVGTSNGRAFLYTGGTMYDLNALLNATGAGWVLQDAVAINDAGQIAGTGLYNGQLRAFLLTPARTAPSGTANFVKIDTATQGNWRAAYGSDGYLVIGDESKIPSYVAPAASGQFQWTWSGSTPEVRALQKPSNSSDRIAATWYNTTPFTIDLNFTDGAQHQIALYCLDWDGIGRRETVDILDAAGNVLNTQALTSSFDGGVYLVWSVSGHVVLRVSWTAGPNAVISGLFFGAAPPAPPAPTGTATFIKLDTATQGNWRAAYGAEGYSVAGDQSKNPMYAAPALAGVQALTWATSTTDVRGLTKPSNAADRIAAAWSSAGQFSIDLNFTDAAPHQVALYCVDWDSAGRRQTIDILDANGAVLNTQSLAGFQSGAYLVWSLSGHVVLRVTAAAVPNGVAGGLFFGAGTQPPPASTATFVKLDSATQGNWRGVYGGDGHLVIGDQTANPSYVTPIAAGQFQWIWSASTPDPRALQKTSNPADRVAATWYNTTPFTIDLNFTDTAQHQVALYCLDWETGARRQTIDILDAAGGVLNIQSLNANFSAGAYLVWNVSGHVVIRVSWTAGPNAVVSGMFFGAAAAPPPPPPPGTATAAFLKADTATQGNWHGMYGADGYFVVGDQSVNPPYVTPAAAGQNQWVWTSSTSEPRALQKPSNPADRIAGAWYNTSPFSIDLNFTDTAQHQIALYCLDWDSIGRRQTIDILDAAGNVLNTQSLAGSFYNGVYLVWNVSGHVVVRVTWTAGANAVVAAVFFR